MPGPNGSCSPRVEECEPGRVRGGLTFAAGGVLLAALAAPAFSAGATTSSGRPGARQPWEETSPGFRVPDDPLLREQWWLFNFGQQIGGKVEGAPGADIRAPEAWSITTGSSDVVVAVLDFGIDFEHGDLRDQVWTNAGETGAGREKNGVDDDKNGYVDDYRGWDFAGNDNNPADDDGHGSLVAGVIAAKGGDSFGITGIAPGVRVMPLRVGDSGVDQSLTPLAIDYAAKMGARIVVQSYTTEPSGIFDNSGAETAAMKKHRELLFVTGSGNDGLDYRDFAGRTGNKPCNTKDVPNLICVGGTDHLDQPWPQSTFGAARVHIAAPAESMVATVRPRQVVHHEDFEAIDEWGPGAALQGFWTPSGPASTFTAEPQEAAGDGHALHVASSAPANTASESGLLRKEPLDLTAHQGCYADFNLAGRTQGTIGIGFFRLSDELRNAFGGQRDVIAQEMAEAGDEALPFSFPLDTAEPLLAAVHATLPAAGTGEIDAWIDDLTIDCWNPEHGPRDYEYWAGTSLATPLVAGVAALIASVEPDLGSLQIKQAILDSAKKLPGLAGKVSTGGRLDAFAALQAAQAMSGSAQPSALVPSRSVGPAASSARSVSFSAHEDYSLPGVGDEQAVPAGRGAVDPAAKGGAGQDGTGEGGAGKDGGGNGLTYGILGLAAVTIGGTTYWYRKRKDGTPELVGTTPSAEAVGNTANDSFIGFVDGMTTIPFTDTSINRNIRNAIPKHLRQGHLDEESAVYQGSEFAGEIVGIPAMGSMRAADKAADLVVAADRISDAARAADETSDAARALENAWQGTRSYQTGGEMTAFEHIVLRHGSETAAETVSKFKPGTTPEQIRALVDEAWNSGEWVAKHNNKSSIIYDTGQVVGTDKAGNAVTFIEVLVKDGKIKSAYPVAR